MTPSSNPAPIYTDTFKLCQWLLDHFDNTPHVLAQRITICALDLLQAITLALKGRRREDQVDIADENLIILRTHIRLAQACGLLSESQMIHVLQQANLIGRQLGGWIKRLETI